MGRRGEEGRWHDHVHGYALNSTRRCAENWLSLLYLSYDSEMKRNGIMHRVPLSAFFPRHPPEAALN